jgi:hypothetical protein
LVVPADLLLLQEQVVCLVLAVLHFYLQEQLNSLEEMVGAGVTTAPEEVVQEDHQQVQQPTVYREQQPGVQSMPEQPQRAVEMVETVADLDLTVCQVQFLAVVVVVPATETKSEGTADGQVVLTYLPDVCFVIYDSSGGNNLRNINIGHHNFIFDYA